MDLASLEMPTPSPSSASEKKEDLGNPFHIEASDREIHAAIQSGLTALLKAKKELSSGIEDKTAAQPFHTSVSKQNSFEFLRAVVQVEIAFLRLASSTLKIAPAGSKKQPTEKEYSVDDLRDILGFLNYASHIRKTHNAHLEQVLQLCNQLLHSSEARFEIANEALAAKMTCDKHPERQAVARSLVGNHLQCSQCAAGVLEPEPAATSPPTEKSEEE